MRNIAVRRLASQQLVRPGFTDPAQLVAWLGAVQGQDYAGAKWSLGLRLPSSTDATVEQALLNRTVVRTWALRGTLHLVAAADLHWLLSLVGPRLIAGNARRYRELELDESTLRRSNAVLSEALQGGQELDRLALKIILEKNGISTAGQRAVYMLQRASLEGLVCQGVMRRNNPTFVAVDQVLPRPRPVDREEALARLAARYFTSRGPATLQDFVWWSGLAAADARAGLETVQSQLGRETADGQTYWFAPSSRAVQDRSKKVFLLPGFDEFLLGYRDRSASFDPAQQKSLPPPNGILPATIVIDGRVAGTWKRTFKKSTVVVSTSPFAPLTAAQDRALAAAADRYKEFLGLSAVTRNPPV